MADTTQPTQVTQYQTGFAPEVAPYAQNLLGTAASVMYKYKKDANDQNILDETGMPIPDSFQPYQSYTGDQVAQFSPLQQQSYEAAGQMQVSPNTSLASQYADTAGMAALGYNQYQPTNYQPLSFTDPNTTSAYMSPYMQNVVDIQKREAERQAGIAGTQRGAQAAGAGAFGGSRQAIQDAEAQRNLATQLGDIQTTGSQAAFQNAQNQFNAEQQSRQQAAQLGEQSRQYGAGLGLQGLQTSLTAAQQLGNLGQQDYTQQMGIAGLQNQMGTQQQGQMQNVLNTQYQDFLNQQNNPYKQMGFMSDILRGVPLTQTGSSVYQAAPSPISQMAGLGTAAIGAASLANTAGKLFARGGAVQNRSGLADLAIYNMG